MAETWMLTIVYGVFVVASSSGTVLGPNQIGKVGPMDLPTCQAAATALNGSSPAMHAGCQSANGSTTWIQMPAR